MQGPHVVDIPWLTLGHQRVLPSCLKAQLAGLTLLVGEGVQQLLVVVGGAQVVQQRRSLELGLGVWAEWTLT